MNKISLVISFLFSVVLANATFAWEGVEISASHGSVDMWVSIYGSPIPGYCIWEFDPAEGSTFHATNLDGSGNSGCPSDWLAHCDSDSVVFWGTWPALPPEYAYSARYEVSISCTVNVLAKTRVVALREIVGNLDTDEHQLAITFPDGSSIELLSASTPENEAQVDLEPGEYQVDLNVNSIQSVYSTPNSIAPYDGHVLLTWLDPTSVAIEPTSWGGIKALYR